MDILVHASERIRRTLKDSGYLTTILHEEDHDILRCCRDVIEGLGFELVKEDEVEDYRVFTFQKSVTLTKDFSSLRRMGTRGNFLGTCLQRLGHVLQQFPRLFFSK